LVSVFFFNDSGVFADLVEAIAISAGADPDQAKFIGQMTSMVVGTVVAIGSMVKSAQSAQKNIQELSKIQERIKLVTSIIQPLATIGKAGADINTSKIEVDNLKINTAAQAVVLINETFFDALTNSKSILSKAMEANGEMFQAVAEEFANTMKNQSRVMGAA